MKSFLSVIVLFLLINACLKDEPFKKEYGGYEPTAINDDWIISTPENEQVESFETRAGLSPVIR